MNGRESGENSAKTGENPLDAYRREAVIEEGPIRVAILPEVGLVHYHIVGRPDFSDFEQVFTKILEAPSHFPGMNSIWVCLEGDLSGMQYPDLEKLALFLQPRIGNLAKRAAFVVNGDLEYGVVRTWMGKTQLSLKQEKMVFSKVEDALQWLQESPGDGPGTTGSTRP